MSETFGIWMIRSGKWALNGMGQDYTGTFENAVFVSHVLGLERGDIDIRLYTSHRQYHDGKAKPETATSSLLNDIVASGKQILSLAVAMHAWDVRDELTRLAADKRQGEDVDSAMHRIHCVMWERLSPKAREEYATRAVGILAWQRGTK